MKSTQTQTVTKTKTKTKTKTATITSPVQQERDILSPDNIALQAAIQKTLDRQQDPDHEVREWSMEILQKRGVVCGPFSANTKELIRRVRKFGSKPFCADCGRGGNGCYTVQYAGS